MSAFSPSFLPFEQEILDRQAAEVRKIAEAKAQVKRDREARKSQEAIDKCHRRTIRAINAEKRNSALVAQCGIRFYTSGWKHCFDCGQPLIFRSFSDATSKPQLCNPIRKA